MRRRPRLLLWLALAAAVVLACAAAPFLISWAYTTGHLLTGWPEVFASAEDAMRANIARSYIRPDKVEILYAGTNSFDGSDPQIWYVTACVRGGRRADGMPVGGRYQAYDQPGSFFLNTKDGWVWVPENAFPRLVARWMTVYGIAGPGERQPAHDSRPAKSACTL